MTTSFHSHNTIRLIRKHKMDMECFIICAIGDSSSNTRQKYHSVNKALKSILSRSFENIIAPLDLSESGDITDQVIEKLLNADLVIANLTQVNPNVMYELAVRHASRKPVVIVFENDTKLPFDIAGQRAVPYEHTFEGLQQLEEDLEKVVTKALQESEPDNPLYRSIRGSIFKELSKPGSSDTVLFEKMESLQKLVTTFFYEKLDSKRSHGISAYLKKPEYTIKFKKEATREELHQVLPQLEELWREVAIEFHVSEELGDLSIGLHILRNDEDGKKLLSQYMNGFYSSRYPSIESVTYHM